MSPRDDLELAQEGQAAARMLGTVLFLAALSAGCLGLIFAPLFLYWLLS